MSSLSALDGATPPQARSWPSRLPFYYGWVNVLVAAVAMSATLPGRTYGLGLIKELLRADLGIGDLRFNALNFWAIILGAVVVLPAGRLIDRIGARTTLVLVAGALGACVLLMSRAWDQTSLFVTLTLVRGLGQGSLSVVSIPGLAVLVQHVPVETEPLAALHRAGFGGLFYEKLGDIHCFQVNGVELREMRLVAWKPTDGAPGSVEVVYKGPSRRSSMTMAPSSAGACR
jgi:MFS family permease